MRGEDHVSASLSSSLANRPKLISARKLAANRANARRSTGPRTEAGKERSSRNAVTHGLTSQASVLQGEDPDELRELAEEMEQDLRPRGAGQRRLVERIVSLTWRLRRVAAAEEAMYFVEARDSAVGAARERRLREAQAAARAQAQQEPPETRDEMLRSPLMGSKVTELFADMAAAAQKEVDEDGGFADAPPAGATYIARQFLVNRDDNAIERLARYEQRLDRQLHAAYRQFIAIRKMQETETADDENDEGAIKPERESRNRQNEPTAAADVAEPCRSEGRGRPPAATTRRETSTSVEARGAAQHPEVDVCEGSRQNEPNVSDGAPVPPVDPSPSSGELPSTPGAKRARRV